MSKEMNIKPPVPYRKRLQWLLGSVIPLLLICYLLGFRKTASMIGEYHRNQHLQEQGVRMADSMQVFEKKRDAVARWQKQYRVDSSRLDGAVLASINSRCDELGLQFKEYKPLGTSSQEIWTRMVTVEGSFQQILQLIFQLEQEDQLCRIASVKYQNVKEDDTEVLNCSLYIQNVVKK
ncbi:hypothetical protein [Niabella drilacis]|uniref:Uncharacterized protein n=1 Tax=Niabella drilacis (strain DSM 25811 / CCM 8410 / CCUG 62505 / LMG 26954 / E90) TaxID=1285928 RepID=A0A1G6URA5_NIADE|nr:hypothetical protein [Niabella drilacis]SDD43097.1 hypothetical protein SAMN04487894_10945 [Niabella drilacis]